MKVKSIISEERVTLPEVRGVLQGVESMRIAAEKEMSYEFRRSIEHANKLAKTTPEKAHELVADLLKMEKMKPEIAGFIFSIFKRSATSSCAFSGVVFASLLACSILRLNS